MTTEEAVYANGSRELVQKVRLVRNIRKIFVGFHPRECVSKLINYLIDNSFCHSKNDYRQLRGTTGCIKQRRLFNNIFAHNGFGFDYLQLYEELHSKMRDFRIVGDMTHTKMISGNGLFFYDFALIYRERLKTLAQTFFPNRADLHKKECDLVIGLQKETVACWFNECTIRQIKPAQHPKLGEIIDYCMRDSEVLYEIVHAFFRRAYTTPFGHGFLPRPFFHSLSSLSYTIFTQCYLRKPIFTNLHSLSMELATKRGGITAANSNRFGIGVFIDENSFYPAVMLNEMPVDYVLGIDRDPYEQFEEPVVVTKENMHEYLVAYNIYRATYCFGAEVQLPTIATKTHDTLVVVKRSKNYHENRSHENAYANFLYGFELQVALTETEGTEVTLFGQIRFKAGDFIFNEFILDQYKARQLAKAKKDKVGDMFHKTVMNSAQGKLGQKNYDNCKMGSVQFVNDLLKHLDQTGRVIGQPEIKQMLTNQVDLFEVRWKQQGDDTTQPGNTVRIPSYIMALARSHLMRIQNVLARLFGDPTVIAYYDTDSVMARFDKLNPRLNDHVQQLFDICLKIKQSATGESIATKIVRHCMVNAFA